jgi:hypothetical protein
LTACFGASGWMPAVEILPDVATESPCFQRGDGSPADGLVVSARECGSPGSRRSSGRRRFPERPGAQETRRPV